MGIIISKTASSSWARSHHILVARHEFQCQLPMSELSAAHQHVEDQRRPAAGPMGSSAGCHHQKKML